jgi:hypothetical protein
MLAWKTGTHGEVGLRKFERFQKLLDQKRSYRYGLSFCQEHRSSLSAVRMVIEVYVVCFASIPSKNETPALVDADGAEIFKRSTETLEAIAWGRLEIGAASGIVNHLQLAKNSIADIRGQFLGKDVVKKEIL